MTNAEVEKSIISIPFDAVKQPVNFAKEVPQIFTRKGEVRKPKATCKVKRSANEIVKEWLRQKAVVEGIQMVEETPTITVITHERISVTMQGEVAAQFLEREDGGLLDLIGNGWRVFIS